MKNTELKTIITAGLIIICTAWLARCSKRVADPVTRSSFLLNTFVTVTLYDSEDQTILDGCMTLCSDYEKLLSRTLEGSEIYKLNHRRPGERIITVLKKTAQVLLEGLEYCHVSRRAFGIIIEPLSSLQDFTGKTPHVPPEEETEADLKKVGHENVLLDDRQVIFLNDKTTIDLGVIAKGFTADQIKVYLEENGVESAVINLGGNMLCVGKRPDGTPSEIGLQRPYATHTETVATLKVDGVSVAPLEVYERHFVENDVNYHHTLDPATGYPYENGLTQVSIISPRSVDGDGLSTTCFALGLEEGTRLAESMDQIYGIFLAEDGEPHYTRGAEGFLDRQWSFLYNSMMLPYNRRDYCSRDCVCVPWSRAGARNAT